MFHLYHIPNKKIGCTTNPNRRTKMQGFLQYEILETHNDIYKASEREIQLQKEYGYQIDTIPYWQSYHLRIKNRKKSGLTLGGKTTGNNNVKSGHLDKVRKPSTGGIAASSIIKTCPYCGHNGKQPSIYRLHFNNCKLKTSS